MLRLPLLVEAVSCRMWFVPSVGRGLGNGSVIGSCVSVLWGVIQHLDIYLFIYLSVYLFIAVCRNLGSSLLQHA